MHKVKKQAKKGLLAILIPLRLIGRFLRLSSKKVIKYVKLVYKKAHLYVAHKPHQHLMRKLKWYKKWHEWRYHSYVHTLILVPYVFIVMAVVLFSYNKATFAADASNSWNFTNITDFFV